MSTLNQDLQATHKILQFIEASKQQGELILDQIPGLFVVINAKGEILRGNSLLAQCLNLDVEELLYSHLSTLFRKEEWQIFNSKLEHLRSGNAESLDFELNITTQNLESKTHLWYLSHFKNVKDELYTVVGKDISELKAAQQNLLEIFSSVPLGIVTIDKAGQVAGQVSAYTEVLLCQKDVLGMDVNKLIFDRALNLTNVNRDSLGSLVESIGNRELIYSVIKDELPSRIEFAVSDTKTIWFGLTFQPIVYEGIVHKVMIILQDITQLVKAELLQRNQSLLEESNVARILQLKRMDPETQPIIFEELVGLFEKITGAVAHNDVRSVCRFLHGIKGCARVSGLKQLTEFTHQCESQILGSLESGDGVDENTLEQNLQPVFGEWSEVFRLYQALCGAPPAVSIQNAQRDQIDSNTQPVSQEIKDLFVEYNNLISSGADALKSKYLAREILLTLESYNQHSLSNIEAVLSKNVSSTAESAGKKVRVAFDWDSAYLDRNGLSVLRECLTHILNNAVDHGIENPSEREEHGKVVEGYVKIQAIDVDGELTIRCIDDGRGFNIAKIRDIAIRKALVKAEVALNLSDEEIVDLIFAEEFSSAEQVTEISGRGIGLAAVRRATADLGGSVRAILRPSGAEFEIVLPSERSLPSPKKEVHFGEVLAILNQEVDKLRGSGYDIQFEIDTRIRESLPKYLMYGEPDAVIFAIIQLIVLVSINKSNKLLLSTCSNGILELRMDGQISSLNQSRKYILDVCSLYLQQHRGGLRFADNMVSIRFGYLKH